MTHKSFSSRNFQFRLTVLPNYGNNSAYLYLTHQWWQAATLSLHWSASRWLHSAQTSWCRCGTPASWTTTGRQRSHQLSNDNLDATPSLHFPHVSSSPICWSEKPISPVCSPVYSSVLFPQWWRSCCFSSSFSCSSSFWPQCRPLSSLSPRLCLNSRCRWNAEGSRMLETQGQGP